MTGVIAFLRSLPARKVPTVWSVLAMACVLCLVLLRLENVIQTRLPINQTGDFAFHYSAAKSYVLGFGPYGDGYKTFLTETFPGYPWFAWLYPAQTLAVLLPFAAFEPGPATEIFFRLNAVCLVLGVFLSWAWVRDKNYVFGAFWTGIFLIPFVAGMAGPAMSSLLNSNFSNILLAGIVMWAHGGVRRNAVLQGSGLALLMLKPSIALAFLLISLIVPAYRSAALIAIVITTVLYLIGSSYADPFTAFVSYLGSLSTMGEYAGDSYGNLIGIFAFIRPEIFEPNALLTIACSCVAAGLAVFLGKGDVWKTCLLGTSVVLLLLPMHLYDMIFLAPALFLSVTRGPFLPRAVLFCAMVTIVLGGRVGALGFDAGLQFQTIVLAIATLAIVFQRFD